MTAEEDDGTPTEFEAPFHDSPRMPPILPRTFYRPASTAACAYVSETSCVDSFTDMEEDNNPMAPAVELLLGIGSIFAAKEGQVQNTTQVLG
jgi:hypothetical protein